MRGAWLWLLAVGCVQNSRPHFDGGIGPQVDLAGAASDGDVVSECAEEAKLVYLVDQGDQLFSFDPPTKKLKLVGQLNCVGAGGTPFSMSVDRNAVAWVLYS